MYTGGLQAASPVFSPSTRGKQSFQFSFLMPHPKQMLLCVRASCNEMKGGRKVQEQRRVARKVMEGTERPVVKRTGGRLSHVASAATQ